MRVAVGQFFFFLFNIFYYYYYFFFLNKSAGRTKKCNIIHVCAFLGMRSLLIGLILVLEGGCISFYPFKVPFFEWLLYIQTFYFNIFVWKCKIEYWKKKKNTLVSQYFGSVGKGQTNIFFRPDYARGNI